MNVTARAPTALPAIVLLSLALLPATGAAQAARTAGDQVRVFLDCSYYCDMDYVRTEIPWVDHMRDRADADVHVLVTRQSTGGGGAEYALEFIGLRRFAGRADTLRHNTPADATGDVTRRGLTHVIKLGLVPFVAGTPTADRLVISVPDSPATGDAAAATSTQPARDPWNFWTFTVGVNGNMFGESQANSGNFSGNTTANRTTEAWKINLRLSGSYNEQKFKYVVDDEEVETRSIRRSYSANTLFVRSMTPHLSLGARATASMSTVGNTALSINVAPAIEYNYFPYSQSTRRSLLLQYSAGARYADYNEVTIFDEIAETRPVHTLMLGYSTRQPWGSIGLSIDASQYLHDSSKYNAGIGGGLNLRIVRGLSVNLNGGYTRVRDQLSLAKRTLTEEEVLLRQRQLATAYNYYTFFGISYRFGSIFNNVVNPRFGPTGGGEIIFM